MRGLVAVIGRRWSLQTNFWPRVFPIPFGIGSVLVSFLVLRFRAAVDEIARVGVGVWGRERKGGVLVSQCMLLHVTLNEWKRKKMTFLFWCFFMEIWLKMKHKFKVCFWEGEREVPPSNENWWEKFSFFWTYNNFDSMKKKMRRWVRQNECERGARKTN